MPSPEIDPDWVLFCKNVRFTPCFRVKSRKIITVIAYHNYGYYMVDDIGLEPMTFRTSSGYTSFDLYVKVRKSIGKHLFIALLL